MTEKKQPEALRLAKALAWPGFLRLNAATCREASDELFRLHALCEEQKRLLEQAEEELLLVNQSSKTAAAITAHLLQQEGEKHA